MNAQQIGDDATSQPAVNTTLNLRVLGNAGQVLTA
jgi:hypothetical protein